ncbi:hypothetical protein SDJN02_05985, partial [Cucurbita argyrosperma subsp. argyrosperma]
MACEDAKNKECCHVAADVPNQPQPSASLLCAVAGFVMLALMLV